MGVSGRARLGAEGADCTGGAARGSLRRPIPCFLDEADDKFAYFNRFVHLESDDLLSRSGRRWVRAVQGSAPHPYTHALVLQATHIQEVV